MKLSLARALRVVALLGIASASAACGDDEIGETSSDVASAVTLRADAEPLASFKHGTGLLPKDSPAQVAFELSAGGPLAIEVSAKREGEDLAFGSGKLTLDLHFKMKGRLKVDTRFKKYDGDIPGVTNLDVPVKAEAPLDSFVLDGNRATVEAPIPETKLPPIPLGSVPGELRLTIAGGNVKSTFRGTCLEVSGGSASYAGEAETTGTLKLKATLALKLPSPLNKEVDVGTIDVPLPSAKSTLKSAAESVAGVRDATQGTCSSAQAGDSPAPTSGSETGSAAPQENEASSEPPVEPAEPAEPADAGAPPPPPPATRTASCTATSGRHQSLTKLTWTVSGTRATITSMTVRVTNGYGRNLNDVDIYVKPPGAGETKAFNSGDVLTSGRDVAVKIPANWTKPVNTAIRIQTHFDQEGADPSASCALVLAN